MKGDGYKGYFRSQRKFDAELAMKLYGPTPEEKVYRQAFGKTPSSPAEQYAADEALEGSAFNDPLERRDR